MAEHDHLFTAIVERNSDAVDTIPPPALDDSDADRSRLTLRRLGRIGTLLVLQAASGTTVALLATDPVARQVGYTIDSTGIYARLLTRAEVQRRVALAFLLRALVPDGIDRVPLYDASARYLGTLALMPCEVQS